MARSTSVSSELQLRLIVAGAAALPVRAGMLFDARDPYAVQVAFYSGQTGAGDCVQWTFARSLLSDGATKPTGDGDVQVWPSSSSGRPVVCLSLSSPSGQALFELPRAELMEFLGRTYRAVPAGAESRYVDVDAELATLLGAEPGA